MHASNKIQITIWLLTCFVGTFHIQSNTLDEDAGRKYVIGFRPKAGFFSNFLAVLNNLSWCEKNYKLPVIYWDENCSYYHHEGYNGATNVWEYYFEPVSGLSYTPGDLISLKYQAPGGIDVIRAGRSFAHNIITRHIKLNKQVEEKIQLFFDAYMRGNTLIGIHLRGTDKKVEEPVVPTVVLCKKANELAQGIKDPVFFVATDEQLLLEEAKKMLKGAVVHYDSIRSVDGKPLHLRSINRAKIGEEVLIEAQLLARCSYLIHTRSNVSTAVLFFNPKIKNFCFACQKDNYIMTSKEMNLQREQRRL